MRIRSPKFLVQFPFRFYARAVGIALVFGLISAIATLPEDPLLVEVSRIEKAILDQGGEYAKQGLAQKLLWGDPTAQSGGQFPNANAFGVMYLTKDPKSAEPNPAYLEIIRRMEDLQKRIRDESYVRAPLNRTDLKIKNLLVAIDRYYVMMEFLFKNYYRVTHRKFSPKSTMKIDHLRKLSLKVSPVVGFLYAQDSDQSQGQGLRVRGTWLDQERSVLASEIRVHETDEQNWELLTLGDLGAPSAQDREVAYKSYLKFMAIRQAASNRWAIRRTMPGGLYLRDEHEFIRGCGREYQSMGLESLAISDAPFFQQLWARDFKSDIDARFKEILGEVTKQELFDLNDARKVVTGLVTMFPNLKSLSLAPNETDDEYFKRMSEKTLELARTDHTSRLSVCKQAEQRIRSPAEFALVGAYQAGDLPNVDELARRISVLNFEQQKTSLICGAGAALGTLNMKSAQEIALEESAIQTADEQNDLVEKPFDQKKHDAELQRLRLETSDIITQSAEKWFDARFRVIRINEKTADLARQLKGVLRNSAFEEDRANFRFEEFFEKNIAEAPAGIYATLVRNEVDKWAQFVWGISNNRPERDSGDRSPRGYRAKEISADFAEIARSRKSRLRADRFFPATTQLMVPQTDEDLKGLYLAKINRVLQGGYRVADGGNNDVEVKRLAEFQSDPLVGKYVEKFFSNLSRNFTDAAQGLNPQGSPNQKGAEGVVLGKVLLSVSRQTYEELRKELGMPIPVKPAAQSVPAKPKVIAAAKPVAPKPKPPTAAEIAARKKAEQQAAAAKKVEEAKQAAAQAEAEAKEKEARSKRVIAIREKMRIYDEKVAKKQKILPSEKVTQEERTFYISQVYGQPSRVQLPESAIAKTDAHSELKVQQHLQKQALDVQLGRVEKKEPTAAGLSKKEKERVLANFEEWLGFMGLYHVTVQPAKLDLPIVVRTDANPAKGETAEVGVSISSWKQIEGMLLAQDAPKNADKNDAQADLRSAGQKALNMTVKSINDFSTNDWQDMLAFASMSILDQEILSSLTIEDTRMLRPFLGVRMSVEANTNPVPKNKKIGIRADLDTPTVLDHLKASFDPLEGKVTNLALARRTFRAGIRIADESQKRMIEDFCLASTAKVVQDERLFSEDTPLDLRFKQVFVAMAPLRATLVPVAGIKDIDEKIEQELKTNWEIFRDKWDTVMSSVMVIFVTVLVVALVASVTGGAGLSLIGAWSTMVNGVASFVGGGIQAKLISAFLMAMIAGLDPFSVADILLRITVQVQMTTGLYEHPEMNAYFVRLPFRPGAAISAKMPNGSRIFLADNFNQARRAAFRMRFANSQMGGMEGMKISYQDLDADYRAIHEKIGENVSAGLFNLVPLAFFKTAMGFKGRKAVMELLEHLPESSPNRKALLGILSRSPKQIIQQNGKNVAKTAYELLENAVEKWWTAMYRMDKVTVFRPGATIDEIKSVYQAAYREALGNLLEKEPQTMARVFRKEIDDLRAAQKALRDQLKTERAVFDAEWSAMPVSQRPKIVKNLAEFRNGLLDLAKKMTNGQYAKYRVLVPERVLNQVPKVYGSGRLLAMRRRILILEGQVDDLNRTATRLEYLESNYLGHVSSGSSGSQMSQYYEALSEQDIQDTIFVATKRLEEFKGAYSDVDQVRKSIVAFEYVKLERQSVYELLKEQRKNDLKTYPGYLQIQSLGANGGIQATTTAVPNPGSRGALGGNTLIIHLN